jgi:NADH-quinone oxidoreductase subunit H
MKFAMFYLVEYAEALALSAVIATLFLSGWKGPLLPPVVWLIIKVFAIFGVMIWTRATFPRVRIDQLMALAWKFLLPASLINLIATGIEVVISPDSFGWIMVLINWAIALAVIIVWSRLFKLGWFKIEIRNSGNRASAGAESNLQKPLPASDHNPVP